MRILERFGENRLEFVAKLKIIKILRMIPIGQGNVRNLPAKICAFGPKMKKNLKNFKKIILSFFDQNLYGKLTFSQIFTKYFLEFYILSESIYPWNIISVFYNNFSDFEE